MGKEYKAKVFKSGNSLALRLPKELGLKEGSTMVLREQQGEYRFVEHETPVARLDVDKFWGRAKGLRVPARSDFDERPSTIAKRLTERGGVTAFLLDTDCSVYAMLGLHPALRKRLAECEPGEVAISAVSFAEIMMSQTLGHPPDREVIEDFVSVVPILPFNEAAARSYAQLPFKRARFDRLLAAHALSIEATVVTNNEVDFANVPGLKFENWTI